MFLENMFKVLKVAANNEQQKDLAALAQWSRHGA